MSFRSRSAPTLRFTLEELRSDPLAFLSRIALQHGDIVPYSVDDYPCVFVNDPVGIGRVLVHHHWNYIKAGTPDVMMLRPILGDGLLTTEGAAWRRQRAIAQPAFHRERVASLSRMMVEETTRMLEAWEPAVKAGRALEIEAETAQLTLTIVARALFGFDATDAAADFSAAVQSLNRVMGYTDFADAERRDRFSAALETLHRLVDRIVEDRIKRGDFDNDDLLSTLLAAENVTQPSSPGIEALRDQIITFLMAGHETTAKSLTWTLYLIDQHPHVQVRLQREIETVLRGRLAVANDVPALRYTWMTVQEAMRLFPPVWTISRKAVVDDTIGDAHVRSGSLVLISPYALHRHPKHWANPERFEPERFEAGEANLGEHTYLPFGGGPRRCIGNVFARVEATLALATILQRHRLTLVKDHTVEPDALVTLRPRFGMPMTAAAQ